MAASLLSLVLLLTPLLGLVTPYLVAITGIAIWVATLLRGRLLPAYSSPASIQFLSVFLLLALSFAVTADAPSDALRAFNFVMLLLYGPVALLLAQRAGPGNSGRVAALAAVGVVVGLLVIGWDSVINGTWRATGINIGPIVLSNALMALGFLALGGALVADRRWMLYLLAPAAALTAILLTGSRGPLLGVPALLLFALVWFWRQRFHGSVKFLIGAGIPLVLIAIAGLAILEGRSATILAVLQQLLSGGGVEDDTTRIRFLLYDAGWRAFLEAPWLGHGWANKMQAAAAHLAPEDLLHAELPQLHNDVLNFAVAAGVPGVLAYFAILATPLVGALRSARDSQRRFRIYGAGVLTITYFFAGLTDLMFGFEFHTMLFVMLTAVLLGYCRDQPPAVARNGRAAAPPATEPEDVSGPVKVR